MLNISSIFAYHVFCMNIVMYVYEWDSVWHIYEISSAAPNQGAPTWLEQKINKKSQLGLHYGSISSFITEGRKGEGKKFLDVQMK